MHVETGTRRKVPVEKTDASKPRKSGAPRVACDYHLSKDRHMTSSCVSGCGADWGVAATKHDLGAVFSAGL
jgi:hypothetical protein